MIMMGWAWLLDILPAILGCISIILGAAIYFNASDRTTKQIRSAFSLFAFSMGIWQLGITGFLLVASVDIARLMASVYYSAGLLIVWSFLVFVIEFTHSKAYVKHRLLYQVLTLSPTAVFIGLIMSRPSILMLDIDVVAKDITLDQAAYLVYVALFVAYGVVAMMVLWSKILNVRQKHSRNYKQMRAIGLAMAFALPAGFLFDVFLPLIGNYELIMVGPLFTMIIVATIYYTIRKYQLFNIKYAAVRTVSYICTLTVLASIYYVIAYIISNYILSSLRGDGSILSPVNVFISLILVVIFQPVKRFFDRITNGIFYKNSYTFERFYEEFNRKISGIHSIKDLLGSVSQYLSAVFKSERAFILLHHYKTKSIVVGTKGHGSFPKKDVEVLDEYVTGRSDYQRVILTSEVTDNRQVRYLMLSHHIELLLPLYSDTGLIGYVFLGGRKSGQYSYQDAKLLEMVAGELVIAIQNALSVQEIRDLNDNLQRRIDEATSELRRSNAQLQRLDEAKDEFVSMASHQLRTPLTSVKGYIDMVIQGDVGEVTEAQKHLLREAFTSSERMVHLINDFLNVSRLQTGKFIIDRRPVDPKKMIAEEIDSLKTGAEQRQLKLAYKVSGQIPKLNLDEGKMRQVVMNFIDNALYYSRPQTTIKVSLTVEGGQLVLKVTDTGIGVPKSEQAHLFTKFFRATNARKQRPDGTGVGLFLAKKVVTSHGGKVIFESQEGAGSTFGFSLPLKPNSIDRGNKANN